MVYSGNGIGRGQGRRKEGCGCTRTATTHAKCTRRRKRGCRGAADDRRCRARRPQTKTLDHHDVASASRTSPREWGPAGRSRCASAAPRRRWPQNSRASHRSKQIELRLGRSRSSCCASMMSRSSPRSRSGSSHEKTRRHSASAPRSSSSTRVCSRRAARSENATQAWRRSLCTTSLVTRACSHSTSGSPWTDASRNPSLVAEPMLPSPPESSSSTERARHPATLSGNVSAHQVVYWPRDHARSTRRSRRAQPQTSSHGGGGGHAQPRRRRSGPNAVTAFTLM